MSTIYQATPTTSDSGNDGLTLRNVLSITGGSLGQVRVTFKAGAATGWVVDHASIGISNGTAADTTATPVELTFSGGHGFNLGTAASITSDWVNLPGFTSSNKLVVVVDNNASASGGNALDTSSGPLMYFNAGTSYNVASPTSGFSNTTLYSFVNSIETQAAGLALVQPILGKPIQRSLKKPSFPLPASSFPTQTSIPALVSTLQTVADYRLNRRKHVLNLAANIPPTPVTPKILWWCSSDSNNPPLDSATGDNWKIRPANVTKAGNALILKISYPHGNTPTITDNNGNTWPASPQVTGDAGSSGNVTSVFVLFNANAGATTVNVFFNNLITPFFYEYGEITNVTAVGGTKTAVSQTGSTISVGAYIPTNNDALGGNLVVTFFDESVSAGEASPSSFSPGGSSTLISTNTSWGSANAYPHAATQFLQTSAASINPSVTLASATTSHYNCVSLALSAGSAGADKDAGIHVDKILHGSKGNPPTSAWKLQFPAQGNLWVCEINLGDSVTGISDSSDGFASNTWTKISSGSSFCAIWYREGRSVTNDLVISIDGMPGTGFSGSVRFYDISGAASSNTVDVSGNASGDATSLTVINNAPTLTPTSSGVNGLAIVGLSLGQGPALGFAAGAPSGTQFDLVTYDTQTDISSIDNSDGCGHYYVPSTTTLNFNWTITSLPSNSFDAVGAVFKAASTGISGTLAATETTDTASFSGGVLVSGSLVVTETTDTAVFNGDVLVSGTLAVTETTDIAAFSGTVGTTGTFATTETTDTAAFSGGVLVSGTLVTTETTDTAAFNGDVVVSGSLSTTEVTDIAAFNGDVVVSGTLVTTETTDTAAFSGTVGNVVTGSLATTEATDTLSFSGGVLVSGSLGVTDTQDTPTFAGGVLVSGSLSVTESQDTGSFSGSVTTEITGSFSVTDTPDTAAFIQMIGGGGKSRWLDDYHKVVHREVQHTVDVKKSAQVLSSLGGHARAASLTSQQRTHIATMAAKARWR